MSSLESGTQEIEKQSDLGTVRKIHPFPLCKHSATLF